MPRSEQKVQTRERILAAAARSFRSGGFGGVGIDGLSKAAGVTSGAFYTHFSSKAEAFKASIVQGVTDVLTGVKQTQAEHGKNWWAKFVGYYLHEKRKCELADSCGLQSLSADVARADDESRAAFTNELQFVAKAIVDGPDSPNAPETMEEAYAALATLVGAVTLARAVNDPTIAKKIASSAEKTLIGTPTKR